MAKLITDADKAEIRAAIQDLTDTFFVTPCTYYLATESLDKWQGDRMKVHYFKCELMAMEEYDMTEGDRMKEGVAGTVNYERIKLTFNFEDLERLELTTADYKYLFTPEKDIFVVKGLYYKPEDIYYDGPLDSKNVLLIIEGRLLHKSKVDFSKLYTAAAFSTGFDSGFQS